MPTSMTRRELLGAAGAASLVPLLPLMNQTEGSASVSQRRRELYSLLGKLPPRDRPVRAVKRDEREQDGYVLETWDLDLNGIENVPAYLARPRAASGRLPAIL